jgi:hypothetical protein
MFWSKFYAIMHQNWHMFIYIYTYENTAPILLFGNKTGAFIARTFS